MRREKVKEIAYQKLIQTERCYLDACIDPYNKRVRIDDIRGNIETALEKAEEIVAELGAEKLIIKARKEQFFHLLENGFQCEGVIDQYFLGSDGYFFCKYYELERQNSEQWLTEDGIVKSVQGLNRTVDLIPLPEEYKLIIIQQKDAPELAALYKEIFKVYPTPLDNPDYIRQTIDEGTIYYAFKWKGEIVSAASAEVNFFYKNAELTDCATLPAHRKYGLMKILLEKLEEKLRSEGIYCSYSLARALSFGMNAALHQLGYVYRGRLMNNCYIFEQLENMNVWVKDLTVRSKNE